MTLTEYKNKSSKLKKSIDSLSKELNNCRNDLKSLEKQFKSEFYTCSNEFGEVLTNTGEIQFKVAKKSCNKIFKKSKLYTVKLRSMEVECVHEDWFNSGGNEYQLVYIEKTYKMCPNCFKLHQVAKEIVYRLPTVYDRSDDSIYSEQQRLKMSGSYKNEIKVFNSKGEEVKIETLFNNENT